MKELIEHIKWQSVLFLRNNLIAMCLGITAFYMLVIYFLKDIGNIEKFLTLLIISDPALIGLLFIGFSIILEKDQNVLSALFVTPINHHFFLISKVFILSIVCLFCAIGMVLIGKGTSLNFIYFSFGILSICVIFSFVGIYLVSRTTEILHYILRSIPLIFLLSLPMFNYFEITNLGFLKILPMQGSLYLISNSFSNSPIMSELRFGYLSVSIWTIGLYLFVFREFKERLVNA